MKAGRRTRRVKDQKREGPEARGGRTTEGDAGLSVLQRAEGDRSEGGQASGGSYWLLRKQERKGTTPEQFGAIQKVWRQYLKIAVGLWEVFRGGQ